MKEAVTKVIDKEDFRGAFQKLLERYNKCIAAGGDYLSFMCVLSIKVPIRKSLETYLMILVYFHGGIQPIYIYIYIPTLAFSIISKSVINTIFICSSHSFKQFIW